MSEEEEQSGLSRLKELGPTLIVAAVVIGPGSIFTSTKVGAQIGYQGVWIPVLFGILMFTMVMLAARVGLSFERTPCGELAHRLGAKVAAAIGIILFLIIASFQTSNNIAVIAGLEPLFESTEGTETTPAPSWLPWAALGGANALALLALYGLKRIYGTIETLMKILVLMMMVAFLVNCILAAPSLIQAAKGLIPVMPEIEKDGKPGDSFLIVQGLIGTTFSVAAAFYQAYLVRERRWTLADTGKVRRDATFGITTLATITIVIMITSAAIFHGRISASELRTAGDIARQLEPLFGQSAKIVFSIGLFAAAFSSFLVNAIIGGTILADGLGLGSRMGDKWPRHMTALALVFGMAVGMAVVSTGWDHGGVIVFAQALTVVGVPALALALIYLGTRVIPETGRRVAPAKVISVAWIGFVITLVLAMRTIMKLAF